MAPPSLVADLMQSLEIAAETVTMARQQASLIFFLHEFATAQWQRLAMPQGKIPQNESRVFTLAKNLN